jgi:hypothetical protein
MTHVFSIEKVMYGDVLKLMMDLELFRGIRKKSFELSFMSGWMKQMAMANRVKGQRGGLCKKKGSS